MKPFYNRLLLVLRREKKIFHNYFSVLNYQMKGTSTYEKCVSQAIRELKIENFRSHSLISYIQLYTENENYLKSLSVVNCDELQ